MILNVFERAINHSSQSINVVDCPEFRDFVLFGRTDVSDTDLPHRTSLKGHMYEKYKAAHRALLEELKVSVPCVMPDFDTHIKQDALGRISFTSDIWSDPNLTSFMAVTVHFSTKDADGRLITANRLLAFRIVEGRHDGKHLSTIIVAIFREAGILHKVRIRVMRHTVILLLTRPQLLS